MGNKPPPIVATVDTAIRTFTPATTAAKPITISATQIEGDTRADGTARQSRQSVGTRVITKRGGKWLLKVAHNTIIAPLPSK